MNEPNSHSVIEQIKLDFPVENWRDFRTMIAVSGGLDSVALLRAMVEIARLDSPKTHRQLIVAHVNHAIRDDAEQDAEFVAELAERLDVQFVSADRPVDRSTMDSEESLRTFRYDSLSELALNRGARFLLLGHQKQDNVETILFRLFRGTGLEGLKGIPQRRLLRPSLTIVRPMLQIDRLDLESYLRQIGQAFRSDPTNASDRYTRNFIRNQLLPQLERRFATEDQQSVASSILRLSQQATETQRLLDTLADELIQKSVVWGSPEVVIDRSKLAEQSMVLVQVVFRIIWKRKNWSQQKMTSAWWQKLATLAIDTVVTSDRFDAPGGIDCKIENNTMRLAAAVID
ncbi:MAG: tRNA lysidine(34) synthetase TilS [Planctomycetota bacterium]